MLGGADPCTPILTGQQSWCLTGILHQMQRWAPKSVMTDRTPTRNNSKACLTCNQLLSRRLIPPISPEQQASPNQRAAQTSNKPDTRDGGHTRRCPQSRQTMWHEGGGEEGRVRLHQEAMRRRWDAWGWLEFRQTGWEDSWTDRHVLTKEQTVPCGHETFIIHLHTYTFTHARLGRSSWTRPDVLDRLHTKRLQSLLFQVAADVSSSAG